MPLSKTFKTDEKHETQGVILDYGDTRIRIARAGGANKEFAKKLDHKTKPYRRAIQSGALDIERAGDILKEVYAETVVLDWQTKQGVGENGNFTFTRGIDPIDLGKPSGDLLPPTPENIVAVFKNLPDLFLDIQQQAQSTALFRAELDEAAAGN